MSSFPGILQEIENVSIDRFDGENLNSTAYFLSHCHYDHMTGLRGYRFKKRLEDNAKIFLYCSPVSKLWLSNLLPGLEHKIKELPINSSVVIDVPGTAPGRVQSISVTALPAGHCPGSVMFFISSDSTNVLYTGDIRMGAEDFKKMKMLKGLCIDKLYLDTTFYASKYSYFPSRDESMKKLVEFCKDWLDQHEKNVIDIRRPALIGIEYAYITLHAQLGMRVHVTDDEWQQYARIPELARAITLDETKTRIHACVRRGRSGQQAQTLRSVHTQIDPAHIRSVKPCALHASNLQPNDEILKYHAKAKTYKLVYSSHCSHDELREIIAELSPRKVIPCVVPDNVPEEEVLESLFPETPVSSSFESTVDHSPITKRICDDQPMRNCSQSSTNSLSSNEDASAKRRVPFTVSSQRYAVKDSSDDEINLTPPNLSKSSRLSKASEFDREEPQWSEYLQAAKKSRN